jgi:hypothetical protein
MERSPTPVMTVSHLCPKTQNTICSVDSHRDHRASRGRDGARRAVAFQGGELAPHSRWRRRLCSGSKRAADSDLRATRKLLAFYSGKFLCTSVVRPAKLFQAGQDRHASAKFVPQSLVDGSIPEGAIDRVRDGVGEVGVQDAPVTAGSDDQRHSGRQCRGITVVSVA